MRVCGGGVEAVNAVAEQEGDVPVVATKNVRSHSGSLLNGSRNTGWSPQEERVFRLALLRYGVGSWTRIVRDGVLPGKTASQMVSQVQRLLLQQSLGQLEGLNVDVLAVRSDNQHLLRTDPSITVKSGCIINVAGPRPLLRTPPSHNSTTCTAVHRKRLLCSLVSLCGILYSLPT